MLRIKPFNALLVIGEAGVNMSKTVLIKSLPWANHHLQLGA